jgi:hypothetical protein
MGTREDIGTIQAYVGEGILWMNQSNPSVDMIARILNLQLCPICLYERYEYHVALH